MIRSSVSLLLVGLTAIYAQTTIAPGYFGAPVVAPGYVAPHTHVISGPRYVSQPAYVSHPAAYVSHPAYVQPAYVAPKVIASVPQIRSGSPDKDAQVVAEARDVSFDGNFQYGFDSNNGISVKSKGYLKPPTAQNEEPIQVIEGSYSYVDAYGKPQTIQYVADENGYRAFGEGIPQPPEAIQKSLAAGQR